jgi:pyrimidine-specific ribonucleoside hydrolase
LKRKPIVIVGIILGSLILFIIVIWPMAPLWAKLGAGSICIQGNLPKIKLVPCSPSTESPPTATPLPTITSSEQEPIPIIFDDDGSPDGMIALLYFLHNPRYDVRAVTISSGEAHPDRFAPQIIQLLALLGKSGIPVGVGRLTPLEGSNAFPALWRQASDSFWEIVLPQMSTYIEPGPAAELMVETFSSSSSPMQVFVSGTHTNLAEALRLDPGLAEHISGVYVMGGNIYVPGNIESDLPELHNQVAEWNIWVDPLAAHEVFASALPLHLIPLDATNQVTWTEADALGWVNPGTPEGQYAADILRWVFSSWSTDQAYIWDLVAAVVMADSRLCPMVPLALDVNTTPGPEQGQILVGEGMANVEVCLQPDAAQVRQNVVGFLGGP